MRRKGSSGQESCPSLYTWAQTDGSDGRNAPDSRILEVFDERRSHGAGPQQRET